MSEMSKGKELQDRLSYQKKSYYETASAEEKTAIFDYARGYMAFLDAGKTEREAVEEGIRMAEKEGYTPYSFGEKLKAGDKRYYNNRGKNLFLIQKGSEPLDKDGIRILAAHVDAPRIDLKQNPLYESANMAFFKTHYYGGIRKYQWTAIPLALHGVVLKADGETVNIRIGEDDTDPVFYITDLLPHLAQNQNTKPLGTAFTGEDMNILVGGMPYKDADVADKVKLNVLAILNEKYGITETDFLSSELSIVPAFRARDIGFDRALIGAYGHDDRVCAYPEMTAMFAAKDSPHTLLTILADKEEIGSEGNTGMRSRLLLDIIEDMAKADGVSGAAVRAHSFCLSADVAAAYDPNFADVYEKNNASMLSCGATLTKFTGSRGKSGSSDASAEFVSYIRRIFEKAGVPWQTSELGKVDIGGGGTVAMYIANLNIDTVDVGVGVISMHAPYEVVSKCDVYALHKAFLAFCRG
ncbi:MAG: aminopeptidase [Ruminococcaceae bacterium]|nr:aminopeptidase [Oscillospiraceae bacterium]